MGRCVAFMMGCRRPDGDAKLARAPTPPKKKHAHFPSGALSAIQERHRRICVEGIGTASSINLVLGSSLVHLGLSLARTGLGWGGLSGGVGVASSHRRKESPSGIQSVEGHSRPQQPGPVASQGRQDDAAVGPVHQIPQRLRQARRSEVGTRPDERAVGPARRPPEALEVQLHEQLRAGEDKVQCERDAAQRGAEHEAAQQPEEQVDAEGEVECLV